MSHLNQSSERSLVIRPGITMTIFAVKRRQARVGISAPENVSIDRTEVRRRKQMGGSLIESDPQHSLR